MVLIIKKSFDIDVEMVDQLPNCVNHILTKIVPQQITVNELEMPMILSSLVLCSNSFDSTMSVQDNEVWTWYS